MMPLPSRSLINTCRMSPPSSSPSSSSQVAEAPSPTPSASWLLFASSARQKKRSEGQKLQPASCLSSLFCSGVLIYVPIRANKFTPTLTSTSDLRSVTFSGHAAAHGALMMI